jgi:uncharacterized protein YukE
MAGNDCGLLDTRALDAVKGTKDKIVGDYDQVDDEYGNIVNDLLTVWEGRGADAFRENATKAKSNIGDIYETLKTMSDTLTDCRLVIGESDNGMGEYNSEPK